MAQTEESAKTSEINKEEKEAVKEQSDIAKILEQEASFCLANGKKNFLLGEVVTAVFQLNEACELLTAMHGKTSDEVADAYYIYGSALLEMSRIVNGIGGTAMKGEEREKIEDQDIDAMTEEREEKKSDDKAEEETLKSQTSGGANDDAKPVTNGHTNGVNGYSETNGDAKPTDISNSEEKQNSPTNVDKETEEKATEHNNNEDKKANAKETEENEKPTEMETEDKENEKPTEMETDGPKEKGKETEGAESEDLEGDDLEGEDLEGEDLEGKAEPQDEGELSEGEVEYGSKEPKDYSNSIQRAGKMLRQSITIYSRGTTEELKIKLSEAYMKLGEVCMERAQYLQAIGNFEHCLEIQRENLSPEIAETYFIIGLCCGYCEQYDESLSNYRSAVALMESKIAELQPVIDKFEKKKAEGAEMSEVDEPTPEAKKEKKHLERLLLLIKAKIEDTLKKQSSQEKVKKHVQENIAMDTDETTVTTGFGEQPECSTETSDEPKSASDITHLVSEKRKQDDEEEEESTKKAKVEESDSKKEESKSEESKSEEKKRENDQKDTDEKMDTST